MKNRVWGLMVFVLLSSTAVAIDGPATTTRVEAVGLPGFSDPVWWPLRHPALTSCAWTNCTVGGNAYHGNFAIDWVDADVGDPTPIHDPVHAAGSGIFHIGNVDPGCRETGDVGRQGTWAWIDHGGGIATYYGHLDSITQTEGAWVTPASQIGTMGNSGATCSRDTPTYYLHFEIRSSGYWGGSREPIPSLRACRSGREVLFPEALPGPWTSWDQISIPDREVVPATDDSCIPASFAVPDRPVALTRAIGPDWLELGWGAAPSDVDEVIVSIELWSPSLGRYGYPKYTSLDGSAILHRFTSLVEGRQYRLRVAFRNSVGSSRWPVAVVAIPGAPPDAPTTRYVNEYVRSISYGWNRPAGHGYAITGYQVAIRRWTGSTWSRWTYASTTAGYMRFDGLISGARYQFRSRAANALGWSTWSTSASGVPG